MARLKDNFNKIIDQFNECTNIPTSFLRTQPELEDKVKSQLKSMYDLSKKFEDYHSQDNATLKKLITSNFDAEQIWQQIEIQNNFIFHQLEERLSLYINDRPEATELVSDTNDDEEGGSQSDGTDIDLKGAEESNLDEDEVEENENEVENKEDYDIKKKKTVRFDIDDLENQKADGSAPKSSFEERQERLQSHVEKLEEEALAEKSWQYKGEVTVKTRPENSLLEEYLEFDVSSRPAPIITEEAALKLEDVILKRIKDRAWDDVEKKFKPVETPYEFKKNLVLDQEKSKISLAKIYENEYLKQKEIANPENKFEEKEEPREHKEIRNLLDGLFHKLDALSNYHYCPMPAAPELQVLNNLPAVSLEEAIPAAVSDATLLAPEEIQSKKQGELMSKEERSKTDKKRSRRKKKLKQKFIKKTLESREKRPGKEKFDVKSVKHFQEDLDNVKASKSSKQFFDRLQDTVAAGNQGKRKKETVKFDAKKIKL